MKKIYTAFALAALCTSAFATFAEEATPERRPLVRIQAQNASERHDYSYDENYNFISEETYGEDGRRFNYSYDEKGNQIRKEAYQDLDGDGIFSLVYYIEYTYDENNRMIERRNYNYWPEDDDYELGGVTIYTYNEAGNIDKMESFYNEEKTDPAERELYTYNEKNLLVKKVKYKSSMIGWSKVVEEQYRYTDKDELQEICYITHDAVYNRDQVTNYRAFKYDDEGNITEDGILEGNHGTYESKTIYHYLDIPASEVAYPITMENTQGNLIYNNVKKAIDYAETYRQNPDNGQLLPYDDYTYAYTGTPVTEIGLNPSSKEIEAQDAFQINVTVMPLNASYNKVTWKSENTKIARVNASGYVVGVSEGTTNIIATATDESGVTATCVVTVKPRGTGSVEGVEKANLVVATIAQTIIVSGLEAGENYAIATLDGKVIAAGQADGNEIRVEGLGTGVYVVSAAGQNVKTIVK